MKRWSPLLAGLILLVSGESVLSQLLFREGMESENYARNGYNKYGLSFATRSSHPKYDNFGNYLIDGVRVYDWVEQKTNSRHLQPGETYSSLYKTNDVDKGEYFRNYLNNIVVVSESQKSFSSRFIVGDNIRVKFSPLTLDMAALNGVRWDFNIRDNNNLTFISSRSDLPLWFSRDMRNDRMQNRLLPVYLTGGHFERKFGIFNVAANYVNQYKSDSSQSRQNNSITGTLPYDERAKLSKTLMLVVKLEDGSKFDGNGPRIYDLVPKIDGVKMPGLLVGITKGDWKKDFYESRATDPSNIAKNFYENRYMLDPRRVPQYVVFDNVAVGAKPSNFVMAKRKASVDPNDPTIPRSYGDFTNDGNEFLQVNGEDYLQFWFEMPTKDADGNPIDVTDVEFWANVGNDYKFSISEVYNNPVNAEQHKNATYFNTVLESHGNIKDMSNQKWVKFRHGRQTAQMLMGFKIDSDIKGFKMVAEYNKNYTFRQFMHGDAQKYREDAEAYYINIKKDIGKFSFGTEYFKMEPGYSTTFENVDYNYDDMKTTPYDSWDVEFNHDISILGGSDNPSGTANASAYMNNTMVLDSVDDNDDKDQYPDWHLYSKTRDRNGIFPGLDKNGNNRPDTNENDNVLPDYVEPFFLYYSDPDEYDYGDDNNNNGVIDEREDDDKPDYPYEIDSEGYHVFGTFGENMGWKYTLGVMNFEQIAGGGKTDVKYGKVEYNKFIPFFADMFIATQAKKVEDTIQNNVFRHARNLSTTLADSFTYSDNEDLSREGIQHDRYYDLLYYRDSYVSTSYFQTKLFRVPNLTIDLKFKYDINHQNENSYQNENDVINRTQIVKADYKYYYKDLLIMPQVKFMSRKMTNSNRYERALHEQYFYPILRVEYPLTVSTTFKAGAQGFPGLNSTVRNVMNNQLDYDERHYLLMLSNRSLYNGYDFYLNFGYEVNWQDLKGISRNSYSRTDKIIFIRLIVGMEPVS